jgi:hypothetical protein
MDPLQKFISFVKFNYFKRQRKNDKIEFFSNYYHPNYVRYSHKLGQHVIFHKAKSLSPNFCSKTKLKIHWKISPILLWQQCQATSCVCVCNILGGWELETTPNPIMYHVSLSCSFVESGCYFCFERCGHCKWGLF